MDNDVHLPSFAAFWPTCGSSLLSYSIANSNEGSGFDGPIRVPPNYQERKLTLKAILSRIWLTPANNGVSYLEPASMYTPTDAK